MTRKDAPVVCVENAIQASTTQNGYFNRRAFMDFVERHSNDAINVVEFQDLDIALVHIYWQTICSYDSENCTITDEVPIDKLLQTFRPLQVQLRVRVWNQVIPPQRYHHVCPPFHRQ